MNAKLLFLASTVALFAAPATLGSQTIDLPTSKQFIGEIPGIRRG